ncbi:MAG: hypothetical protein ACI9Y1_001610 [Lentisphaeria bacterium]
MRSPGILAGKLPHQRESIENTWSLPTNVNWDAERLQILQKSVRQMTCTAGSFGLAAMPREAKKLDTLLFLLASSHKMPETETKAAIRRGILAMFEKAEIFSDLAVVDTRSENSHKYIVIVADDSRQAELLRLQCEELGCETAVSQSLAGTSGHVKAKMPDLILMAVGFPEGSLAG